MKFLKLLAQTIFYIIIVLNLIFIVVIGKITASIICEELIYKILIIGDLFAILDIGEFVNIIVFALLGMGFGLASALLPKYAQTKTSAVLLIILVPILFSTSAFVKYNYWIEDFADRENISFSEAEKITNTFLHKKVNAGGFFGFYSYTAQFPVLPTKMSEITKVEDLEKKVKSDFINLGKIAKLRPEVVYGLLAIGSWAIRFFYFSLAALATVYHFHLGQQEISQRFQPDPPKFPAIPPRFKPPANKPLIPSSPRRVRNH